MPTLPDYMKGGESIEDFLQGFPNVKKAQILMFLEEIEQAITPCPPYLTVELNINFCRMPN